MVVVGANTGASTDPDGAYVIMNLPPGIYQLRVTLVGYGPVSINQVRVTTDQTTVINASMITSAVQLDDVVIQAERPMVQKDLTATFVHPDERADPHAAGKRFRRGRRHAPGSGRAMGRRCMSAAVVAMKSHFLLTACTSMTR